MLASFLLSDQPGWSTYPPARNRVRSKIDGATTHTLHILGHISLEWVSVHVHIFVLYLRERQIFNDRESRSQLLLNTERNEGCVFLGQRVWRSMHFVGKKTLSTKKGSVHNQALFIIRFFLFGTNNAVHLLCVLYR